MKQPNRSSGPGLRRAFAPVGRWLVGLGLMIWLAGEANQVASPSILGLEFARTTGRTMRVVTGWMNTLQVSKARSSVWPWDIFFILAYIWVIAAACSWGKSRMGSSGGRAWAAALTVAMPAAGLLDIIEDIGLVKMIVHPSITVWPAVVFGLATAKFAIIVVAVAFAVGAVVNRMTLAGEELLLRLTEGEAESTFQRRQAFAAEFTGSSWSRTRRYFLRWLLGIPVTPPAPPPPRPPPSKPDAVGICCSGGGIRSAAFNLGALQTFTCEGILAEANYLTAVSGGSYMAASYALVTSSSGATPLDPPAYSPGSPEEHYLRNHSSYLGPPGVLGKFWMVVRALIGIAVNLGVLVLALFVTGRILGWWYGEHLHPGLVQDPAILSIGAEMWIVVVTLAGVGVGLTMGDLLRVPADRLRRLLRVWSVRFLAAALIAFALLIGVPWIVKVFRHLPKAKLAGTKLPNPLVILNAAGIGTLLTGAARALLARRRSLVALLAGAVAGPLLVLGLFVYFVRRGTLQGFNPGELALVAVVTGIFLIVYAFSDLTTWSPNPFYKRALWGAFGLHRVPATPEPVAEVLPYDEAVPLSRAQPKDWPQLIVCAAANTSDEGATPPGRNATSFTFSSEEIGGPLTTYVATAPFEAVLGTGGRDISLISAVAISGAAISPSMGKMTKGPIRFLMALLNVRLGVWLPNPLWFSHWVDLWAPPSNQGGILRRGWRKFIHTLARLTGGRPRPRYLLKELMGWNHLGSKFLYVSDGGHYENLGLVELMRRRCRLIYCIDASGGEEDTFFTLGEAVALARTELQVEVTIRPQTMAPLTKGGYAPTDFVVGTFTYPEDRICPDGASPGGSKPAGVLIFVRAAVTQDAPDDVRSFRQKDPRFPHHGTQDQFFNEAKFEAYRALGAHIARGAAKVFDSDYNRPT